MADSVSSPATLQSNPQQSESGAPNTLHNQSDPVPPSTQSQSSTPSPAPLSLNPNSNLPLPPPPPPPTISYAPQPQVSGGAPVFPPSMPSFRPLPPQAPQFSPLPNPGGAPNMNYQNPSVQPPGVAGAVPQMQPMMSYQVPPGHPANPALRPYSPMPNGYTAFPAAPQGSIPPAVS